ncbi:hypothetical protein D8S78_24230 [Natrialba swarupiae]|nr:hypothetical protein [Natrialba swarupiae]
MGIFVVDFFDIVPVGRERVVERINDPVVILNGDNRVLDSNPAARRLATPSAEWHGIPVSQFSNPIRNWPTGSPPERPAKSRSNSPERHVGST